MGRYSIDPDKKSKPVCVSLAPNYIEMLKDLEKLKKMNKSQLIQKLIKDLYIQEFGGLK